MTGSGATAAGPLPPNFGRGRGTGPSLVADLAVSLHRAIMREPVGTTRKGQLLLGVGGLIVGLGCGIGLQAEPEIFEPILEIVLYTVGCILRTHLHYDPSQRAFFVILLATLGALWALLSAYAFAREPARNRAVDAYLRRKGEIDQSQRAAIISQDDGIA